MYTEIKEAVAFLFRFYSRNSPRRRIALLMTEFANLLMHQYRGSWDITDPKKGEELRMIDLCYKKDDEYGQYGHHWLFATAAQEMQFPEILQNGPTPEIKLFINPGMVYYTSNKEPSPVIIWVGDVNADYNYNPMPLGIHSPPKKIGKTMSFLDDVKNLNVNDFDEHNPLVLHLEDCHPKVEPSPIEVTYKKFVFYSKDHQPVSVAKFAQTRFGSNRIRPDHEKMRRIQFAAALCDYNLFM